MSAEIYKQCATIGCNKEVKTYRKAQGKTTCFSCEYWYDLLSEATPRSIVTWYEGELIHYTLGRSDSPLKGFGGEIWKITAEDGEEFEWNNVWYQGPVPETLHELFLATRPLVRMQRTFRCR